MSENYKIRELDIDENNSYILNHNWHGNVRELRNLIERIAILQPDTKDKISNIIKESLKNTNFDDQLAENSLSVPLKEAREKFEKEYLTIQLKKFNGNISKTAKYFLKNVKSSIAMHNTSTQFADGGEFGFGGEVGISKRTMNNTQQILSFNIFNN